MGRLPPELAEEPGPECEPGFLPGLHRGPAAQMGARPPGGGPAPPSKDQRESTQILALLSHLKTIVLGSLGIGEGNRFPKRSPHYPLVLSSTEVLARVRT